METLQFCPSTNAMTPEAQIDHCESNSILECGPMPNVIVALSNICGALCSTPQSLADAHYCQDAKAIEICRGASNYRIDLSR